MVCSKIGKVANAYQPQPYLFLRILLTLRFPSLTLFNISAIILQVTNMAGSKDITVDGTDKQPMVRLDIYVKRHPSLTSEQFHEYVTTFLSFDKRSFNQGF